MNWPIPKNIVAVDISGNYFAVSRAKYSFGKILITYQNIVFSENREEWKKILKFKFQPEDVIVTTIDTGMTLFIDAPVPLRVKRIREIINIGKVEAARIMGIPIDSISVTPVGKRSGKYLFAVAKNTDIEENVVRKLKSLELPEPDIVIPDSMKYLQVLSFPTHGNAVYVVTNFFKNYTSMFLVSEGEIVGVRSMYPNLEELFQVLKDEFGLTMPEVNLLGGIDGSSELYAFLKEGFTNLSMEINRELVQLLRTGKELAMGDVSLFTLVTDPICLSLPLSNAISEVLNVNVVVKNVKGLNGLLLRGGMEFGKVKSLQQKK